MSCRNASNRQLTLLRKLGQKKYREQEQLFLVEGENAVTQVLGNEQIEIDGIFTDEHYEDQKFERPDVDRFKIPSHILYEIADTENPQGIIAVCRMPAEIAVNTLQKKEGIIVAIDSIQDPGNLGTIIRTSAWFGVKGLLFGKGTVDPFHPKVVRSTAGAIGMIPHLSGELTGLFSTLEDFGWNILLLDAGKDAVSLHSVTKSTRMVLVIGNEAQGINKALYAPDRLVVKIPSGNSQHNLESLNASIAASVALYHLAG